MTKNAKQFDHDYVIDDKVLIMKVGLDCKAWKKHVGPFSVAQGHTNGTVEFSAVK